MSLLSGLGTSIGTAIGGSLFGGGSKGPKRKDIRLQYEEANRNIPLTVQAYKDAGIHPLYGLSAQQFQPQISVGSDNGFGRELGAQFGQNIGRAAASYLNKDERLKKDQMDALGLERAQLENDLLRSQISVVHQQGRTPGLPGSNALIAGQGDAIVVPKQDHRNLSGNSPGTRPGLQQFEFPGLGKVRLLADDATQPLEDMSLLKYGLSLPYIAKDAWRNYRDRHRFSRAAYDYFLNR